MVEANHIRAEAVHIEVGKFALAGDLALVPEAHGIILFAHGSGSSRHSPRNRFVATVLQRSGLSTLLMDLLTPAEEQQDQHTGHLRFDIRLLADRLATATRWLAVEPRTADLKVGYFGASTGGGAAIMAATLVPDRVGAVVSRGGRPDLAGDALAKVRAPTLLIVGGHDQPVIALNERAFQALAANTKQLVIVPGATHLFQEHGALEQVAHLAADWFLRHLDGGDRAQR